MPLSLKSLGTMPLLVVLLVITQASATEHEASAGAYSSGPSSAPLDLPRETEYLHPTDPGVFLMRVLKAWRAERDRAIEAAVHPLRTAQATQQQNLAEVTEALTGQQFQLVEVAGSVSVLEDKLNLVRQELDGINSSFARWLEPLQGPLTHALNAIEQRLQSLESRLNATESRLDSNDHPHGSKWSNESFPRDCSELPAGSPSGVYLLQLDRDQSQQPVSSVCDMETDGGGWTVFQRRDEGHPQQDFFLEWAAYREGFGDPTAEFWWGLENLWRLTAAPDRRFELRIDLYDFDGDHLHASYDQFGVSYEEDGYRLLGGRFTGGGAGDSLSDHFGHRFSTKDRDQDTGTSHCARKRKGGWWYHACHDANLNGPYLAGRTPKDVYGVNWPTWRGWRYSLKKVEMKIRPKGEHY